LHCNNMRSKIVAMEILKQVGAIPMRKAETGELQVLLVTSRDTGRWVIPKGWRSRRLKDSAAAAREAKQEGGVTGRITRVPIGQYRYRKRQGSTARTVDVAVFLLKVRKQKKRWTEQEQRHRAWFNIKTASRRVREPRLRSLILSLGAIAGGPKGRRRLASSNRPIKRKA
jgi:8-oxo-dGTP pyrophosphatase MutT (NUDIX family)